MNPKTTNIPYTIAVDFDGTLVKDMYPGIGTINQPVWDAVLAAQSKGAKLILWTCRNGYQLQDAVIFCADNGLHFDAINENLDEVKVLYKGDTRKVFADVYIDDRNAKLLCDGTLQTVPVFDGRSCKLCGTKSPWGTKTCPVCGNAFSDMEP